jgi:phage gpG-like protein
MITAKILGQKELLAEVSQYAPKITTGLDKAVNKLGLKLLAMVKTKLSGDVLKVRTNVLRSSINLRMQRTEDSVFATVGTNVVYAKTHELGLTIPEHIIEAKNKKALKFQINGLTIFAKRVKIPPVKMKKRSFLVASLNQLEPTIKQEIEKEILKELGQ